MSIAHKLRDIEHQSNVVCTAVGRRSGRVMAIASAKAIAVWVLGKQTATETFTDVTSTPKSIGFDAREELLAIGTADGSVKIWDLIQRQLARSFPAHTSPVTAIAFHPHAQFFATGSEEGELKVWDLKSKNVLQAHKAHHSSISVVRFSPDGQWLITGAEEGSVKVWALAANAMLTELQSQSPVTCFDFHPKQLIFAVGTKDGSIRFWSLEEKPELISTITYTSAVLAISFTAETALAAVHKEALRVLSWAPQQEHECRLVQWGGEISDAAIARDRAVDRLIVLASDGSRAPMWVTPLCKPGVRIALSTAPVPVAPAIDEVADEAVPTKESLFKSRKALRHSPVAERSEAMSHVSPAGKGEESPSGKDEEEKASKRPERDSGKELDIGSFLSTSSHPSAPLSDDALMEEIMQPHATMCGILSSRLTKADAKGAVEAVAKMGDNAVLADVTRVLLNKKDSLSTEVCTALFPLIKELLSSQYDDYVATGLAMFKMLIRQVALFLKSTRDLQNRGSTKDVSEKRLEQSNSCYEVISELNPLLAALRKRTGNVGANARDVLKMPELVQFYKAK